jgi:hypothetical protein
MKLLKAVAYRFLILLLLPYISLGLAALTVVFLLALCLPLSLIGGINVLFSVADIMLEEAVK